MEAASKVSYSLVAESFLNNWNVAFPNFPLKVSDLKEPHAVMGALLQIFDRLGIDCDAVLAPPNESERTEHTPYYWDLLPVINVTRVVNYIVSIAPQVNTLYFTNIEYLLQPTITTSHTTLVLLFNLMVFNENQMREIAPHEKTLFGRREQVKMLEEQKLQLQEKLNEQAEEKGKRANRLEEMDKDIENFQIELKQEREAHDLEKQELEVVLKENQQLEASVEQKKSQKDALMTEVARKRTLRVYDANDIRTQAEQAVQHVQEAEEKLDSLRGTLMQKEHALKNLQNIKPNLDVANNCLHEIMKFSDMLRDMEYMENEPDNVEGELETMQAELRDAQAQLAELRSSRVEFNTRRTENQMRRQQEKAIATGALDEAENRDKKNQEKSEKAMVRVREIKQMTAEYEEEKNKGMEELMQIKNHFYSELKMFSDALLKKTCETEKHIENKLKNIH